MPVKLWLEKDKLVELLMMNIQVLLVNQMECSPEEARQIDYLLAQRQLWIDWLSLEEGEEIFIGLYPASEAGEEYDDEAAVILGEDPDLG